MAPHILASISISRAPTSRLPPPSLPSPCDQAFIYLRGGGGGAVFVFWVFLWGGRVRRDLYPGLASLKVQIFICNRDRGLLPHSHVHSPSELVVYLDLKDWFCGFNLLIIMMEMCVSEVWKHFV